MKQLDEKLYKKQALKKVRFSLLIVALYVLGSSLPITGGNLYGDRGFQQLLEFNTILNLTGLSLSTVSIFSLGLAPWMSTMIIWRILYSSRLFKLHSLTQKQSFSIRIIISVFLGFIQSYGIVYKSNMLSSGMELLIVIILVGGLCGLIWLGELNRKHGFGGVTLIIIINIFRPWPHRIYTLFSNIENNIYYLKIIMGLILLILLSLLTLVFLKGERRIPLMRIMLGDQYSAQSYFPIPNNPAGAMPLMYAFSLSILPQYLLFIINNLYKNNKLVQFFYEQLQLDQLFGIILLIITMVLLTYAFSYVNIDYKEISERLKISGDYFNNVYPGNNTESFLFRNISIMATKAVCFNMLILGVPILVSYYIKGVASLAYFIPTWFMFLVLSKTILDEFKDVYYRNNYLVFIHHKEIN